MTRVSEIFSNPVNNRGLRGKDAFNCECLKDGCAWWDGEGCGILSKSIVKSIFEEEEVDGEAG